MIKVRGDNDGAKVTKGKDGNVRVREAKVKDGNAGVGVANVNNGNAREDGTATLCMYISCVGLCVHGFMNPLPS